MDAGCMGGELEQGASGGRGLRFAFCFGGESVGREAAKGLPQVDFLTFYHCFLLDYPKLPGIIL